MTLKPRPGLAILAVILAALAALEFSAGDSANGTGPLAAVSTLIAPEAHAVVGRPLTPVSYAGVARRTSRRTARRVARRN